MTNQIHLSARLQSYIERNADCFDNWNEKESTIKFYTNLPIELLEEFNNLLISLGEEIDLQETYMNVFDWLLHDVTIIDPKNDSYDIYTEDEGNLICMEYETQSG